jgi:hypothetical protein
MPQDHWLPGFNFNVEEWFEGDQYETLAICRTLALARTNKKGRREKEKTGGLESTVWLTSGPRARRKSVNRHCDLTASVSPFSGRDWGRLRLFVWSALLIETKKAPQR